MLPYRREKACRLATAREPRRIGVQQRGAIAMGRRMMEDDIYIGSLFDLLNLRFAPSQGPGPDNFGGIDEMAALQKEFQIFKRSRSFRDSAAIMNLGGFWNARAKNRWHRLLDDLKEYDSNQRGKNGNDAIVSALIKNLESADPLPVYFKAHDSRIAGERQVFVSRERRPLFYIEQDFLTISLPMMPRPKAKQRRKARAQE
jgi:hypothetical protein